MISMKDIAAKCHVSVATVSKALNGHHDIGEETKKRIKKTADELGYFPNTAARALKTRRTFNIGVLFSDDANSGLTHEYFAGVLESVKSEAERRGYDVTFINHFVGGRHMTYYEHCRYRDVDGVVIACVNFLDPDVVDLVNSEIPVVTIDHLFNNCTVIMSDNVKGMRDLVSYALEQGHRRISYLHGADSAVTSARLGSFYRTMEEHGLKVEDTYVRECAYQDTETAKRYALELMQQKNPPTCIIFPDDVTALAGTSELNAHDFPVPSKVSVMGFDGIRMGQMLSPKLTTLSQDVKQIGSNAARCLIERIERPKTTLAEIITIEGTLLRGGSVKNQQS